MPSSSGGASSAHGVTATNVALLDPGPADLVGCQSPMSEPSISIAHRVSGAESQVTCL